MPLVFLLNLHSLCSAFWSIRSLVTIPSPELGPMNCSCLGLSGLSSGRSLALSDLPLPALWPGNTLYSVSWEQGKGSPFPLPLSGITVLHYLKPSVWKWLFHVFRLFVFSCSKQSDISSPCYSALAGSGNPKCTRNPCTPSRGYCLYHYPLPPGVRGPFWPIRSPDCLSRSSRLHFLLNSPNGILQA